MERIKRVVPTLETVMAAGYKEKPAKQIVQQQTDLLAAEDADPAAAEAYTNAVLEAREKQAVQDAADAAKTAGVDARVAGAKAAGEGDDKDDDKDDKAPAEGDGTNPNAPDQPLSIPDQIAVKRQVLADHRTQMKAAKERHEANLVEVQAMRKALLKSEASVVDNEYERLTQTEHEIMSQLAALENAANSKQVGGQARS